MTKTEWLNWVEEAWNKAQRDELRQKLEQADVLDELVAENQRLGLYDSPKREWVGLTDEEFEQLLSEFGDDPRFLAVEIEIRLMERNT